MNTLTPKCNSGLMISLEQISEEHILICMAILLMCLRFWKWFNSNTDMKI